MIELNTNKVRVRCLECREEHFIEIELKGTEKEQRSMGYEYEHTYKGKMRCTNCGEKMKLEIIIFEYPKDWVNYVDESNKGCLIMDKTKHSDNKVIFNEN